MKPPSAPFHNTKFERDPQRVVRGREAFAAFLKESPVPDDPDDRITDALYYADSQPVLPDGGRKLKITLRAMAARRGLRPL